MQRRQRFGGHALVRVVYGNVGSVLGFVHHILHTPDGGGKYLVVFKRDLAALKIIRRKIVDTHANLHAHRVEFIVYRLARRAVERARYFGKRFVLVLKVGGGRRHFGHNARSRHGRSRFAVQ